MYVVYNGFGDAIFFERVQMGPLEPIPFYGFQLGLWDPWGPNPFTWPLLAWVIPERSLNPRKELKGCKRALVFKISLVI